MQLFHFRKSAITNALFSKGNYYLFFLFPMMLSCVNAQSQESYYILFYNVENLFDPFKDPVKEDKAYTPDGASHWTLTLFKTKINSIYKTLMACCQGNYPDIIGFAEIENRWVLEQFITKTPLKAVPYAIIHKDSPDPRGIDVALLYRKDRINPLDFDFFEVSQKGKSGFISRDILYFAGKIQNTPIHFFVNHWPSRSEGYLESQEKRALAARILRAKVDSLFTREKEPDIVIMGDFNATPREEPLLRILQASVNQKTATNLINLSSDWLRRKEGTIYNKGTWEIFDQFIVSVHLIKSDRLRILRNQTRICFFPFLSETDPHYLQKKPFRTYSGPAYHGGVSDHLPIVTVLEKK